MPENTSVSEPTASELEASIIAAQAQSRDPQTETPTDAPVVDAQTVGYIAPAEKLGAPVEEKRYLDQTNYIRDLERQKSELMKQVSSQDGVPDVWVYPEAEPAIVLDQVKDNNLQADTQTLRKEIAVMQFNQTNKVDEETDLAMRKLIYIDDPTLKTIWDQNPKAALKMAYKMVRADQLEQQAKQAVPDNTEQRTNAQSETDASHQAPAEPVTVDEMKGMSAKEQEKVLISLGLTRY